MYIKTSMVNLCIKTQLFIQDTKIKHAILFTFIHPFGNKVAILSVPRLIFILSIFVTDFIHKELYCAAGSFIFISEDYKFT